jgi:hypothetical protein
VAKSIDCRTNRSVREALLARGKKSFPSIAGRIAVTAPPKSVAQVPARMALPILSVRNSYRPAPVTPVLGRGNLSNKIQIWNESEPTPALSRVAISTKGTWYPARR